MIRAAFNYDPAALAVEIEILTGCEEGGHDERVPLTMTRHQWALIVGGLRGPGGPEPTQLERTALLRAAMGGIAAGLRNDPR